MLVIIDKEVIDATITTSEIYKLHQLVIFAITGRHTIISNPQNGFETWLNTLDRITCEAYETALEISSRQAATIAADVATVLIKKISKNIWGDPESSLSLDNAIKLLNQPLGIFLENAENDWNFLLHIVPPSEKNVFNKAIEEHWIQAIHGGGTDICKQIISRAGNPDTRLRTFAIFDSDRRHPDEFDPAWKPTGTEKCQGFMNEATAKKHIEDRFWRLNRRCIESYLPRSAIERHKDSKNSSFTHASIDAFFRMPKEARWFFNIKNGFNGDAHVDNAHRSKNLYDSITETDKNNLKTGFGKHVANQYSNTEFDFFDWDEEAIKEAENQIRKIIRLI